MFVIIDQTFDVKKFAQNPKKPIKNKGIYEQGHMWFPDFQVI